MIKIISKTEEKLKFVTDMPVSLLNAARRSVNEIPILAVDRLEINKNDSALYDEIIAHRTGLVPLKNERLKLPEECGCDGKGCGKCSIKLKLKAEGPCTVYSDAFSPKGRGVYKMPIVVLDKGQELELVAIAKMGRGVQHAKFSPGLFHYKYSSDVDEGDAQLDDENFKKVLESTEKDNKNEMTVFIESWGQIKPKEIFAGAVEALTKNLGDFSKQIK